jgi:hypothetical protein
VVIYVEHALITAGDGPWTLSISGPAVRDISGIQVKNCGTFQQCLVSGLRELRRSPGDWEWLDLYL